MPDPTLRKPLTPFSYPHPTRTPYLNPPIPNPLPTSLFIFIPPLMYTLLPRHPTPYPLRTLSSPPNTPYLPTPTPPVLSYPPPNPILPPFLSSPTPSRCSTFKPSFSISLLLHLPLRPPPFVSISLFLYLSFFVSIFSLPHHLSHSPPSPSFPLFSFRLHFSPSLSLGLSPPSPFPPSLHLSISLLPLHFFISPYLPAPPYPSLHLPTFISRMLPSLFSLLISLCSLIFPIHPQVSLNPLPFFSPFLHSLLLTSSSPPSCLPSSFFFFLFLSRFSLPPSSFFPTSSLTSFPLSPLPLLPRFIISPYPLLLHILFIISPFPLPISSPSPPASHLFLSLIPYLHPFLSLTPSPNLLSLTFSYIHLFCSFLHPTLLPPPSLPPSPPSPRSSYILPYIQPHLLLHPIPSSLPPPTYIAHILPPPPFHSSPLLPPPIP
ncbi:hypothetical protein C7M84_020180 [Penaeus vannamei]|uniref:Uncharacterized protein n=1 Tax=Penaeus vannamei TaxID=6689 RepID=A0A3R7LXQ5_PENVA|nr:hypothetical protein C7M84_020180 [Penaeus vannamei]